MLWSSTVASTSEPLKTGSLLSRSFMESWMRRLASVWSCGAGACGAGCDWGVSSCDWKLSYVEGGAVEGGAECGAWPCGCPLNAAIAAARKKREMPDIKTLLIFSQKQCGMGPREIQ